MSHHVIQRGIVRKTPVPTIMPKDEKGPKHGALSNPVNWPEGPAVDIDGGSEERGDGGDVPNDVA